LNLQLADILEIPPYALCRQEKEKLLDPYFSTLTRYHYTHCDPYRKMMNAMDFKVNIDHHYTDIPFLPVRLFKMFDLFSVPEDEIFKTVTSSGTSGQAVSRIFLNKQTAANQTKTLSRIVTSFIGPHRMPMIILDSENVIKDRALFSARGAGILGFSLFGSQRLFALDDKMDLQMGQLLSFLENHQNDRVLLFGFTYMVYQHFYRALLKSGFRIDLSNAVLIHGGGWKSMERESMSAIEFKAKLKEVCGITEVYDYYGMAEQTGSIFMECKEGHLHAPVYADVIIRKPEDFSVADMGEKGIVQVLSVLPESYPGHSLLTEDEGILIGEDNCPCGRLGKYFKITGRLKLAEIRGCSDTYAENNF